jgi:hypothetical protein
MARKKLIHEPPDTDKAGPKARFNDIAAKVFSVPKSEVDEREKRWQQSRPKPRKRA